MTESKRFILIDDDPLVRQVWRFVAKKKGIELIDGADLGTIIPQIEGHPSGSDYQSWVCCVDYHLSHQTTGADIVRELWSRGYRQIFYATGMQSCDIPLADQQTLAGENIISGVVGKEPPFR